MGTTTVIAAAATQAGSNTLLTVVTVLLGSTVLAGLFTTALGNLRASAAARRARYAQVVSTLVAWVEYPYRIRRRTDDLPQTMAALVERGHTLQEQLAEARAWVASESAALSEVLEGCLTDLARIVGPACSDAWRQPPITVAADMVLGSFGLRDTAEIVTRMNCAVGYRFGIRRLMWRAWVRQRLHARGCIATGEPNETRARLPIVPETRTPDAGQPANHT